MNTELFIENDKTIYLPDVKDEITLSTGRAGTPGQLNFNILSNDFVNFEEGNPVRFKVDDKILFYGFIFSRKHSENGVVSITAYDQIRYLKNKNTYLYEEKTVGEFIKMIADDFNLKAGDLEDTGFKIPMRIEDNVPLIDMIQNAIDITFQSENKMYVLYDDGGELTLKNTDSLKLDLLIDEETGESYTYNSSIDSDTYNKIKLYYDNDKTQKREIYISEDLSNISKWGVLQYFDKLGKDEDGKAKVGSLLKLYNKKSTDLSINNAIGDKRVRAGSTIGVMLKIGAFSLKKIMVVEKCRHKFNDAKHFMDLTLTGGDFGA